MEIYRQKFNISRVKGSIHGISHRNYEELEDNKENNTISWFSIIVVKLSWWNRTNAS